MHVLAEIVKSVLVIIILSSFLELLLPDGAIKPFVRFAIGLFVLIAVLNPILGYLFDGEQFQVRMWDYTVDQRAEEEILQNGEKINQQIFSVNQEALQEKLQGQINAVVLMVPGVKEVKSTARLKEDGTLQEISLYITPSQNEKAADAGDIGVFDLDQEQISEGEAEEMKNKITSIVKNMYGLDVEEIQIDYEGG